MSDPTHPHHSRSFALVDQLTSHGKVLVSSHSLYEIYSVITRLPVPHRQPPEAVWTFLNETVRPVSTVAPVIGEPWILLEAAKAEGSIGGRIYDRLITHSVASAGATVLYTWNVRDMLRVAPGGLRIQEP